jgi:phosphoesterase RecJ-like protein
MFDRWNRNLMDEPVATALLAGMISKTQSFRTPNVTPKTLETASKLIAMGAKREEIVHGLWRTKSVPTLRLWGRALARLEIDRTLGLVWTKLSREDFLAAGAPDNALDGIVSDLVAYAPEAKVIVLVHEKTDAAKTGVCVTIYTMPPFSAAELGRAFGASGVRDRVEFCLTPGQPLIEGTKQVIERLRETLNATAST